MWTGSWSLTTTAPCISPTQHVDSSVKKYKENMSGKEKYSDLDLRVYDGGYFETGTLVPNMKLYNVHEEQS